MMLNNIKIAIVVCVCLLLSNVFNIVIATGEEFNVGDFIRIGTYNGVPITWRYVSDDENGMLVVSDKVICFKRYGSEGFWEDSSIRSWLNSQLPTGSTNPDSGRPLFSGGESGFLSDGNFTQEERNLMKSVTQWTMLPANKVKLSENGLNKSFSIVKEVAEMYGPPAEHLSHAAIYYTTEDIPNIYYGAAYQLEDTVFLLDALQLYRIWENFGTVVAQQTHESRPDSESNDTYAPYFLKNHSVAAVLSDGELSAIAPSYDCGIRPAFYLDSSAIVTKTGSGTESDPYILNESGKSPGNSSNSVSVMLNNQKLTFDVPPIMENDRVLVPFRAIFEAIGAEIGWNGDTNTVTAEKGELEMSLQIDNKQITVNGKHITLDVPPRLVGNRTLVPVRAVSECLGATVDWDETKNQVIITT